MSVVDFKKDLEAQAKHHSVRLNLSQEPSVQSGGISCSGYFLDDSMGDPPELAVACGKPEEAWLPILVHESCHMDQWIEGVPEWRLLYWDKVDICDYFDRWLLGEIELVPEELDRITKILMEVELDCEKRVLEKIKKYDLPIDPEDYSRRGLAYVLFYLVVKEQRKWSKVGREPYSIPEILAKMPTNFEVSISQPPKELLDVIREYCFEETKK